MRLPPVLASSVTFALVSVCGLSHSGSPYPDMILLSVSIITKTQKEFSSCSLLFGSLFVRHKESTNDIAKEALVHGVPARVETAMHFVVVAAKGIR